MSEADEKLEKGFPVSGAARPGALRAAALLVAGIVIGCLLGCGESHQDAGHAEFVRRANRLCARAADRVRQMPRIYIARYGEVVPAIARIERGMAGSLKALEAPREDRPSIERFVELLDRQSREIDAAEVDYTHLERAGAYSAYKRHIKLVHDVDRKIRIVALSVGISVCARPPIRIRYL